MTKKLSREQVIPIIGTLEYFGFGEGQLRPVQLDLLHYRYKLYDALGTWLTGGLRKATDSIPDDNKNVLVAFANIYIHTKYTTQFSDYLAHMDLDLDMGEFHSPGFIKKIQQWNSDDLKLMKQEKRD